jgi:SprT protein
MQVTSDIKARVIATIKHNIETVEKKFNIKMKMPLITYDLTGTTAGTANYVKWHIRLNGDLLMRNVDSFIARTVPHELAHLACDQIYPEAHRPEYSYGRSTKREVHGPRWQSIMHVLGAETSRCHSYDVSEVRKKSSGREVKCSGCNFTFTIGPKKAAQLVRSPDEFWHIGCKGKRLVFVTSAAASAPTPVAIPKSVAASAPTPVATPKSALKTIGVSKKDQCMEIYLRSLNMSRTEVLNKFVSEVGMTPAGATTYYYNCAKAISNKQ